MRSSGQETFLEIQPDQFLGPVLGHEPFPAPPHQYLGMTTVMVHPHQPPIVVISTQNLMPLRLSHTKDSDNILGAKCIQAILDLELNTQNTLTNWDKQALMTMIEIRDEQGRAALGVIAAKLRPDPEEELPDPEHSDDSQSSRQQGYLTLPHGQRFCDDHTTRSQMRQ